MSFSCSGVSAVSRGGETASMMDNDIQKAHRVGQQPQSGQRAFDVKIPGIPGKAIALLYPLLLTLVTGPKVARAWSVVLPSLHFVTVRKPLPHHLHALKN